MKHFIQKLFLLVCLGFAGSLGAAAPNFIIPNDETGTVDMYVDDYDDMFATLTADTYSEANTAFRSFASALGIIVNKSYKQDDVTAKLALLTKHLNNSKHYYELYTKEMSTSAELEPFTIFDVFYKLLVHLEKNLGFKPSDVDSASIKKVYVDLITYLDTQKMQNLLPINKKHFHDLFGEDVEKPKELEQLPSFSSSTTTTTSSTSSAQQPEKEVDQKAQALITKFKINKDETSTELKSTNAWIQTNTNDFVKNYFDSTEFINKRPFTKLDQLLAACETLGDEWNADTDYQKLVSNTMQSIVAVHSEIEKQLSQKIKELDQITQQPNYFKTHPVGERPEIDEIGKLSSLYSSNKEQIEAIKEAIRQRELLESQKEQAAQQQNPSLAKLQADIELHLQEMSDFDFASTDIGMTTLKYMINFLQQSDGVQQTTITMFRNEIINKLSMLFSNMKQYIQLTWEATKDIEKNVTKLAIINKIQNIMTIFDADKYNFGTLEIGAQKERIHEITLGLTLFGKLIFDMKEKLGREYKQKMEEAELKRKQEERIAEEQRKAKEEQKRIRIEQERKAAEEQRQQEALETEQRRLKDEALLKETEQAEQKKWATWKEQQDKEQMDLERMQREIATSRKERSDLETDIDRSMTKRIEDTKLLEEQRKERLEKSEILKLSAETRKQQMQQIVAEQKERKQEIDKIAQSSDERRKASKDLAQAREERLREEVEFKQKMEEERKATEERLRIEHEAELKRQAEEKQKQLEEQRQREEELKRQELEEQRLADLKAKEEEEHLEQKRKAELKRQAEDEEAAAQKQAADEEAATLKQAQEEEAKAAEAMEAEMLKQAEAEEAAALKKQQEEQEKMKKTEDITPSRLKKVAIQQKAAPTQISPQFPTLKKAAPIKQTTASSSTASTVDLQHAETQKLVIENANEKILADQILEARKFGSQNRAAKEQEQREYATEVNSQLDRITKGLGMLPPTVYIINRCLDKFHQLLKNNLNSMTIDGFIKIYTGLNSLMSKLPDIQRKQMAQSQELATFRDEYQNDIKTAFLDPKADAQQITALTTIIKTIIDQVKTQ